MSTYVPSVVRTVEDVRREFQRLHQALERANTSVTWEYLSEEPSRIVPGMEILADGTNWDPGSVGVAAKYRRNEANTTWELIEAFRVAASLAAHLADTADAHDASAISFVPVGTVASTDAQAAIAEVATDAALALTAHEAAADPHPGYLTPAEGDAAYQPLDADLTSWAGVTRATGFDTFAATPSSVNLKALVTGETGSGGLVFATSPTLTTPTADTVTLSAATPSLILIETDQAADSGRHSLFGFDGGIVLQEQTDAGANQATRVWTVRGVGGNAYGSWLIGSLYVSQAAITTKAASATLTAAELLTRRVNYTGAAGELTLPTAADMDAGVPSVVVNNSEFAFSIINTGSATATVVAGTGWTTVGALTVAAGASGRFSARKTGTGAWTLYRDAADASPNLPYDPGTVTVPTEYGRMFVRQLTLSGTNRVTVEGTARILII